MRAIFACLILGIAGSASGGVIWFQNREIPIATTFDGVAVNLENGANSTDRAGLPGGDANFVLAGIGITNDADQTAAGASWQPVRVGNVNTDAVRNLPLGQAVGIGAIDAEGAALSYAAGFGGSGDLNSHFPEFTAGLPGYIGFSLVLNNSNLVYGWMRVTLRDDNTAGGFIHEWAFEDDGGPIVVGVIPEPGSSVLALLALGGLFLRRKR